MPEESPLPLPVLEDFEEVGPLVGILIGSEPQETARAAAASSTSKVRTHPVRGQPRERSLEL